jgi:hypothetical protein
MDLIDKGIKGRRTATPETGGPVAASSFACVRESPAPLREVAATITCRGAAIVHQAGSPGTHALLEGLGSLIPAGRRATGWVIEIIPEEEFLTYAQRVPLRKMGNPAASPARVQTAQEEGGPR